MCSGFVIWTMAAKVGRTFIAILNEQYDDVIVTHMGWL